MKNRFLLYCLLVGFISSASAAMYRWTDANGNVHYTDQPPPSNAKSVEEKKLDKNYVENSGMGYGLQQTVKKFPVTLYANECGEPCTNARTLLAKRGIPYTSKDPQQPAEFEALKKIAGSAAVPVLLIGSGTIIKGFEESQWNNALDVAGYPKTAGLYKSKSETKPAEKEKKDDKIKDNKANDSAGAAKTESTSSEKTKRQ